MPLRSSAPSVDVETPAGTLRGDLLGTVGVKAVEPTRR